MVEEKDIDIKCIRRKENTADIMMKDFSVVDHFKHANIITEGELWEIVETGG